MKKITSPHDRFFKAAMADYRVARHFFAYHLPANVREIIDLDTLQLRKESYLDEQLQLSMTDMLYAVNLAKKPGYLYLLAEHQSKPDRWMPFRLWVYLVKIMEQHIKETGANTLPVIYPLVFYHGKVVYPYSMDIFDLFDDPLGLARQILLQPFQLIDVGQIPDKTLRQHVWSGVLELCMKHIFARDILPHLRDIVQAMQIVETAGGQNYLETALNYLLTAGEVKNVPLFIETLTEDLSETTGTTIMTIAQQLREKGRIEGKAEGREEGKHETQIAIARKLIKQGMKPIAIQQITELSLAEIQALIKHISH